MARRKNPEKCCATCDYLRATFTSNDGKICHTCNLIDGIPAFIEITKVWTNTCACWNGDE